MARKPVWQTKTRIFPNAGYLTLVTHEADGSDTKDPSKIYTSDRSIIESITTKFSTTSEDMNDGNSFDPAATHITGRNVEVAVVCNTYDPLLYKFACSADEVTVTDGYIHKSADEYTIPSDGIVKLNTASIKSDGVILVRKADGSDYEKLTTGTPTTGQFTVAADTATLTFAVADAGQVIIVTAEYAAEIMTTMSVASQPKQNVYTLIADGKNCDKDENDELADNFRIDSCKIKGDIQPPARQKNYSQCTYTFALVKPRAGAKAFSMATAKIAERGTTALKALTIGSLSLTPEFDGNTTAYTATTTNASDTITAVAYDGDATVVIKNGSTTVASGSAATWSSGSNTVTVTVTNGSATKAYTITVTKGTA